MKASDQKHLIYIILISIVYFGFTGHFDHATFDDVIEPEDCCADEADPPSAIVFTYVGQDCSHTTSSQSSDSYSCDDVEGVQLDAEVIIKVVTSASSGVNPFVLFEDTVSLHETFVADADSITNNDKFRPLTTIEVYQLNTPVDVLAQRVSFHTSCSEPLAVGDQYGSIRLQGTRSKSDTCGSENEFDWGDAPANYGTTESLDGPNHLIVPDAPFIGAVAPDAEIDGAASSFASGDDNDAVDDEEGLRTFSITELQNAELDIAYRNPGDEVAYLAAWLDKDADGNFDGSDRAGAIVAPNSSGEVTLNFGVVPDLPSVLNTFMRIRISTFTSAVQLPTGPAPNGEVEDFEVSIQQSVLPVELLSFSAEEIDRNVMVNWSTAAEINNDYFNIEKSSDATTFEVIGQISSKGNAKYQQDYSFLDSDPWPGENSYPLTQFDYDGSSASSPVVLVHFEATHNLVIFPNPGFEEVTIMGLPNRSNAQIRIYDMRGKMLEYLEIKEVQRGQFQLDLTQYHPGIYYLQLTGTDISHILKFEKI